MSYSLFLVLWSPGGTIKTDVMTFESERACLDARADEIRAERAITVESGADGAEVPHVMGACVRRDPAFAD